MGSSAARASGSQRSPGGESSRHRALPLVGCDALGRTSLITGGNPKLDVLFNNAGVFFNRDVINRADDRGELTRERATKAALDSYTTSLRFPLAGECEVIELMPPAVKTARPTPC
jgi:short-subunit dehydrogenase involved in D-alanine esterification of teichoic acids